MRRRTPATFIAIAAVLAVVTIALSGATFTELDSTQPRGSSATGAIAPVIDGFRAPARFSAYTDWSGSMMANAMRDPSFVAELNHSNDNIIEYANALANKDFGRFTQFLSSVGLDANADNIQLVFDPSTNKDRLTNEDLLPVTADLCLRCHTPVGWLEGRSEPPSSHAQFLQGQFWGAKLRDGVPNFNISRPRDSETDMEGVTCDFCHRAKATQMRGSLFDGRLMAAGNGGFRVDRLNPFGSPGANPELIDKFQEGPDFCGTCHDVTNPVFKTNTVVDATGQPPDMLHPIERTYTEWFWSSFRTESRECQSCHEPMKFHGAQTWMLTGLDRLWGDLDRKWTNQGFDVNPTRTNAMRIARSRNATFMKTAAGLSVSGRVRNGIAEVGVRVTNNTGHRLPTGFGEGRQMWLQVEAKDANNVPLFQDGFIDNNPGSATYGTLKRRCDPNLAIGTPCQPDPLNLGNVTKVYEHKAHVVPPQGDEDLYKFLDKNGDDTLDLKEVDFQFVLMNRIVKDNRIPPKGFNRAAYFADGAFIVPTNLYLRGENWDDTVYRFPVPFGTTQVTVTLLYQTFNREYVDFLAANDKEETIEHPRLDNKTGLPVVDANGQALSGRARPIPKSGVYGNEKYWGTVTRKIWSDTGNGPAVTMGSRTILLQR